MGIQLKNNASGTLATAISASDTGIVLTTGNGASFPTLGASDYFYATLESTGGTFEVIKVTVRSGDSMTVVRAQEGSTANSFAAGSRIELRVTAASVDDLVSEAEVYTDALRADLAASTGSSLVGFLQSGAGAAATTVQAKLREWVTPEDFGAVGNGTTNDIDALIEAHQTGKTVNYTAGKTYYVEPSVGAYTKAIPITEGQVINGNGASILCTNGGRTIFLIDCRPGVVGHHINNMIVRDFFIASNKTGFANNGPLDFEYFLTIRGGYIMMSSFTNIAAAVEPTGNNPSCRSVIYFDLNDDNGTGDVGAPDGITISDMYLLAAYGTSCGVLFDGATTTAPIQSRVGKVSINNIYMGCINPIDFNNRLTATGKNAPVIFNDCDMGYGQINTLYGGVSVIQLYNGSTVRNTPITGLYNELINPQSSGERGLVYAEAGSAYAQCIFESPQVYAIGTNFAPSYNYKMFDGTFIECEIARPAIYENSQSLAQIPADLINLDASSYGNTIDPLILFFTYSGFENQSDIAQTFITCSQANLVKSWIQPPYNNEARNVAIPGAATTKILEVPRYMMEQLDMYKIRIVAKATSGTILAFASVSVNLVSATTTFTAGNNIHVIEGTIYMNAQSKAINAQVPCGIFGEWITMHNGGNFTNNPASGLINTRTTSLEIYVQTTGAVDILTATIETLRGEYTNKF
jgi:hypothetical protein